MALIKQKELNNGFSVEYNRVSNISIFRIGSDEASVIIEEYKDATARSDGKSPVSNNGFIINNKEAIDQIIAIIYGELKKIDEFVGSVDG